jgi:membrane-bound metal-dependent hydrolase YbcI (DUF457 family)
MPFTPFHFGPGLLLKGAAPRKLSWAAFAASQVFIDCETLYYMVRREYPVHRELHTFLGAAAAGLAVGGLLFALRAAAEPFLRRAEDSSPLLASELSAPALFTGALVGGLTHPFLDGLMHADIRPFSPFTPENPLLGAVSLGTLHGACLAAGLVGTVLLWARARSLSA